MPNSIHHCPADNYGEDDVESPAYKNGPITNRNEGTSVSRMKCSLPQQVKYLSRIMDEPLIKRVYYTVGEWFAQNGVNIHPNSLGGHRNIRIKDLRVAWSDRLRMQVDGKIVFYLYKWESGKVIINGKMEDAYYQAKSGAYYLIRRYCLRPVSEHSLTLGRIMDGLMQSMEIDSHEERATDSELKCILHGAVYYRKEYILDNRLAVEFVAVSPERVKFF